MDDGRLQVGGVYGTVRHPIYGGLILPELGSSLISSPLALATAVVLELTSQLEESMLGQRFVEYAAYRRRVRWRFILGVR